MNSIYLDYNATTPVDARVLEKMLPYFTLQFGNSVSAHKWGWIANDAAEKAREDVAKLINAKKSEVYFTSGATESNNWALQGLINQIKKTNPKEPIHIISTLVEHNSILQTLNAIKELHQIEIDFLNVKSDGLININELESKIKPHTKLISVIWVNNEIGSIMPVREISALAKKHNIYFHTDATQAIGKIPVDVELEKIDLLSFSGHKIYGPKGVGTLYIRSRNPHVEIQPMIFGGGHEKGLRSGTLNIPGIVGLGEACKILNENLTEEINFLRSIQTEFAKELFRQIPSAKLNGHATLRSPNNLNVTFPGVDFSLHAGDLVSFGLSSGSACSSGQQRASHVLRALGLTEEQMRSTLRITWGRLSKIDDCLTLISVIKRMMPAAHLHKSQEY